MSHNPYSPPKAEVADAQISGFDDVELLYTRRSRDWFSAMNG